MFEVQCSFLKLQIKQIFKNVQNVHENSYTANEDYMAKIYWLKFFNSTHEIRIKRKT